MATAVDLQPAPPDQLERDLAAILDVTLVVPASDTEATRRSTGFWVTAGIGIAGTIMAASASIWWPGALHKLGGERAAEASQVRLEEAPAPRSITKTAPRTIIQTAPRTITQASIAIPSQPEAVTEHPLPIKAAETSGAGVSTARKSDTRVVPPSAVPSSAATPSRPDQSNAPVTGTTPRLPELTASIPKSAPREPVALTSAPPVGEPVRIAAPTAPDPPTAKAETAKPARDAVDAIRALRNQ